MVKTKRRRNKWRALLNWKIQTSLKEVGLDTQTEESPEVTVKPKQNADLLDVPLTPAPPPKPDSKMQVRKKRQLAFELNAEVEHYQRARPSDRMQGLTTTYVEPTPIQTEIPKETGRSKEQVENSLNALLTPAPRVEPDLKEQIKKNQQAFEELNADLEAYKAAQPPEFDYVPQQEAETVPAQIEPELVQPTPQVQQEWSAPVTVQESLVDIPDQEERYETTDTCTETLDAQDNLETDQTQESL